MGAKWEFTVWGLAGLELIFPIAGLIALHFVWAARKVLATPQRSGGAVPAQHPGCLQHSPLTGGLGLGGWVRS